MVMGSQSSFEEFVSLRAYGCVAARNDMPSCLLYWSDDGQSVGWGQGVEISMGQFRALTEYLIKEVNSLCNSLMFGLEPDIDLSQIKDDMTNNDNGYSFVTDPRNYSQTILSESSIQMQFYRPLITTISLTAGPSR
jgi:hypothetical protein